MSRCNVGALEMIDLNKVCRHPFDRAIDNDNRYLRIANMLGQPQIIACRTNNQTVNALLQKDA